MKPGFVGPHEIYLGGHMQKTTLENRANAWGFSLSQYVQTSMKNLEEYLSINEIKLPSKALTLIQTSY